MTTINDLTAIEGIDINCSYEMICIDRLNTKVNAVADPTLRTDLNANIVQTNKLKSYQIFNVKEYGAIGDGTTDDTTSINNTIAVLPSTNAILYFPQGTYKITSRLYINNKVNLMIKSDNIIINTAFNGDLLYLNNCIRTSFDGNMTINWTGLVGQTSNNAIVLNLSYWTTLKNVSIFGDFLNAISLLTASGTGSTDTWGTIITNITIRGARTGIIISGEYYTICDSIIYGCSVYGVYVNQVGNASIDNCTITNNNVGIYVRGLSGNNSDHGKISNCIINHNQAANIFLSNIIYSWSIVNNQIWAALGPNRLTSAAAVIARTTSFGIYAENTINVNIIGNHIARNVANIGLDGCQLLNISNNSIMGAIGTTGVHIAYYGNTNTGAYGSSNSQTIISNNTHENVLTSGFNFIYFHDNTTDRNIYVKGNRGTLTPPYKFINTIGTYSIDNCENWVIDANAIGLTSVNPLTDSPNSQATNITVLGHLLGEKFSIHFANPAKWVWIRFKTDNITNGMYIISGGMFQVVDKKAIAVNTSICTAIDFIPVNNNPNGWLLF